MKKSVEVVMFDKFHNRLMTKTFDTKTVKGLAQVRRLDELEYDCDAMVRLTDAIVEVVNAFVKSSTTISVDHFVIYNDFSESVELFRIGDTYPSSAYENFIK